MYTAYIYKPVLKIHHWGCSLAVNEFKTTKIKALVQSLFGVLAQSTVWWSLQIQPYTLFFHRMFASSTQNCQCSPLSSYLIFFFSFLFYISPHVYLLTQTLFTDIHFPRMATTTAPECFTCTNKLIFPTHCKWQDSALTHVRDWKLKQRN